MGSPRVELDETQVFKLARLGCSNVDIADVLGASEATVRQRYHETLARGRAQLRLRLRRAQLKAALKGNVIMQIFLGKNLLGQSDRPDVKVEKPTTELKIVRPNVEQSGT